MPTYFKKIIADTSSIGQENLPENRMNHNLKLLQNLRNCNKITVDLQLFQHFAIFILLFARKVGRKKCHITTFRPLFEVCGKMLNPVVSSRLSL